jgi:hypothetical protein
MSWVSEQRKDRQKQIKYDWSRMPDRPHKCFQTDTFDRGRGLSIRVPISDVAAYYRYDERVQPYCEYNGWHTLPTNQYVTQSLTSYSDYADWMMDHQFPDSIMLSAKRDSGTLIESMEHLRKRVNERDLINGRLDRRKLPRVARHLAAGTYDVETVRPYRRTRYADSNAPTIAIVGSIQTSAMRTPGYTSNMIQLVLTVLWACEASGLPAHAAMVQGKYLTGMQRTSYDHVVQGFMLTDPDRPVPARHYSVFLSADLWMHLKVHIKATDYEYADLIASMEDRYVQDGRVLNNFATRHGGHAVQWAREVLDADIVIAIGSIKDMHDADVALSSGFSPQMALAHLAQQISGRDA